VKITAIIVARNAQELIGDCLKSVNWADEMIVVDNGSTDKTTEIAKTAGASILQVEKGSFSQRRNLGAKKSKGDWLFYIDADERVTPQLKKEIKSKIGNWKLEIGNSAFAIPRRNILLGREMRFGGWWPDYVLRLIKKEALVRWEGELHEQPKIKGKVGKLKNPLTHITHRSLAQMVAKTNEWSAIEARLLFKAGHPKMAWWRFISVAAREFWHRGIIKLGFLDGVVGVIEIIYQMFSRMITYAKLWEMQIEKSEARSTKSETNSNV
jgi:glycosyltransferase involved in cell wall biosynthesis